MKIQGIKNLRSTGFQPVNHGQACPEQSRGDGRVTAFFFVMLLSIIVNSGCNILGVLATPGPFEKKIPPQYDLAKQQDRRILLWVECPRSSGVDYDVQKKLTASFLLYFMEKMKIHPENIILDRPAVENGLAQDPVKIARDLNAGYVLLVQVEEYELIPMTVQNYYSGQLITRSVLMDTDLGVAVWPGEPAGKVTSVGVDLETKGRDTTVSRLVSAAAHCTLRYLYPCEKLKFKSPDEKASVQDAMEEMETY